jgi:hypothetical protein
VLAGSALVSLLRLLYARDGIRTGFNVEVDLRATLISIGVYARYALDSASDKSYTAALCVLSLEFYYRYYLPLLKLR